MRLNFRKNILLCVGIIFFLADSCFAANHIEKSFSKEGKYKKGEILIKYKPSVKKSDVLVRQSRINRMKRIKLFKKSKIEHLKLPIDMTVEEVIEALNNDPDIEFAEPNYVFSVNVKPNDQYFKKLWGLHNTGQSIADVSGLSDADIDAPAAWNKLSDASDVIVAVVDTGVDYSHADLSENIWINEGEVPNNGIDDDNNGKIDDIRGWDFVNNDRKPKDKNGHGTHVAGIIGAVGNNAIGVTGVAWNVKIMPVQGLNKDGYGYTSDLVDAIDYAENNGAAIINASWIGSNYSNTLYNVINDSSAIFVCAAGNSSSNIDSKPEYPAAFDCKNIISVAATNNKDKLANFSNYGKKTVDVGAPGVDIYSTIAGNNDYGYKSGTSMSAPFVSGIAALIKDNLPGYSSVEIKKAIKDHVDSVKSLSGKTVTGGRVNLNKIFKTLWQKEYFSLGEVFQLDLDIDQNLDSWFSHKAPDVAFLNNNYSMAVWTSREADYNYVTYGQVFDSENNKIGGKVRLTSLFNSIDDHAKITGLSNNTFIIVYSLLGNIWGQILDHLGNKIGDRFILLPKDTSDNKRPVISSLENGGFVTIWELGNRTFGQIFDNSGNKLHDQFLIVDHIYRYADVGSISNGGFVVTWKDDDGSGTGIAAQIYDSDANKTKDTFIVNSSVIYNQISPKVSGLSNDGFVVAWEIDDNDHSTIDGVEAQIFNKNGERVGAQIQIVEEGDIESVSSIPGGCFLVTWRSPDEYITGIYARLISDYGNFIGEKFRLNSKYEDWRSGSVSSGSNSNQFFIMWIDKVLGGAGISGIFGRRVDVFDSDQDGLIDFIEDMTCMNNNDEDTDDDGIPDIVEDFNQNFTMDTGETNPCNPDTDGDGILDGTELGYVLEDLGPDTDINVFVADEEPATKTNPLLPDTDGDGIHDGIEDSNKNGLKDEKETDAASVDTDGDGIEDGLEDKNKNGEYDSGETLPYDIDTDDDGIQDGTEDLNKNGELDQGETQPYDADTDNDGIQDGTEIGYALENVGPDTNLAIFQPDLDPFSLTDPLIADTDGDGFKDGFEDRNKNGRFDEGESDPDNPISTPEIINAAPIINLLLLSD